MHNTTETNPIHDARRYVRDTTYATTPSEENQHPEGNQCESLVEYEDEDDQQKTSSNQQENNLRLSAGRVRGDVEVGPQRKQKYGRHDDD